MSGQFRSVLWVAVGIALGGVGGWVARGSRLNEAGAALSSSKSGGPAGGSAGNDASAPARAGKSDPSKTALAPADSKSFAEATRLIFRDTSTERRLAQFRSLVEKAGPEHYEELVELIRENDLRGTGSGDEWSMLWMKWGQKDPEGALRFIQKQDWGHWDPRAPAEAQARALTSWAEQDPTATLRYIEENHAKMYPGRSLGLGLIRGWSAADPEGAGAWMIRQDGMSPDDFKQVVEAIGRRGGQEALDAWYATLPKDGSLPGLAGMASAVAGVKSKYEPEKAAAWIEQNAKEPWIEQSEVVADTARGYAERDPQAAMAWAQRMGLSGAVVQVMDQWCEKDMAGAQTWLKANSFDPNYGHSVNILVSHLMPGDPVSARAWAESIPDPAVRAQVIGRLPPAGQ